MLGVLCSSEGIALLWDLSLLGGLCLRDRITLLLELEYAGWSLFVRRYSSTPGT